LGDQSRDGWVEYLQEQLNVQFSPSPNLKEDGNFDQATLKALKAFQTKAGIQVDGVAGNQTWAALRGGAPEAVGTDGRPRGFVDKGAKARWFFETDVIIFSKGADLLTLSPISVGDAKLEGQSVNVFVTAPGSKQKGIVAKIGPPIKRTPTDEGDIHDVKVSNFTTTFPSTPPGAKVEDYLIEAYFDKALGGDFLTSKNNPVIVVS
jgi:Putative peptidoglycan binding domain